MRLNRLMTVFVWLASVTAGLAVERYVPCGGALSYSNAQDQGLFLNNTVTANGVDNLYVESTAAILNNIITEARGEAGVLAGLSSGDISKWFRYNNVWGNGDGHVQYSGFFYSNRVGIVSFRAGGE